MVRHKMRSGDFLSLKPLAGDELEDLLQEALRFKNEGTRGVRPLSGKAVGLLFEKPSTRTRVSFEVAVLRLGGNPVVLSGSELQLGRGETIEDTGRVLSRYLDGVVMRTFGHDRLEALASASQVPVINALTDTCHPCQALADMLTIMEVKGELRGIKLAYTGDGNNVAHSLMRAGTKLGMHVTVSTPPGRGPAQAIVEECNGYLDSSAGSLLVTTDPGAGVAGADVVYTDAWVSMGGEAGDPAAIESEFGPYQVNQRLLRLAGRDAIVLHCLPAHRGQEITDDVIDGSHSAVWEQAENRLHVQIAVLAMIFG